MWERLLYSLRADDPEFGELVTRAYTYLWGEHAVGTLVVMALLCHWVWLLRQLPPPKAGKKPAWEARLVFGLLAVSVFVFFVWADDESVRAFWRYMVVGSSDVQKTP